MVCFGFSQALIVVVVILAPDSGPAEFASAATLTCEGGLENLLPTEFFEKLQDFQSAYNRDSLARSREFLYTLYLPKISIHLEASLERCPAAVLEIMMNSVLAIDADYNLDEAQQLYKQIMQLAADASSNPVIRELLDDWKQDTAHTYPFLLGMSSTSCYNSSLRIYVYDVPENLTRPTLPCAHGQWATEVLFHRFFSSAACRTEDPDEADFFYVPVYGTCLSVTNNLTSDEDGASVLWDPLVRFLSTTPWLTRRNQRDHIFLFADGQSARIWDSYDLVQSEAIFMMTESKCPTWDLPVRRYSDIKSCSSGWKDIIIPGHTDHARIQHMLLHNRPSSERDILMTFHGRHPGSHEVYSQCEVRGRVMDLADKDGVDVGGFVDDYLERKGRSHFCLIPGGTSPWTNHLYESFFCGCIPVILSDEYEVAFQHLLDWPRFSIKWPEAAVGDALYDFLRSIPESHLRIVKAEVDRHACWFNYHSEDPECSPFLAVLRALEERKRRFPPFHGRFWNAEAALADLGDELPKRTTRFHTFGSSSFIL
mmetsp:Transcript_22408/g.39935  ORF Transcript_22408/g.39935 Transcript_22408/m.39935 type:complete len:539 (+) Transcript_22408:181-1797(+)